MGSKAIDPFNLPIENYDQPKMSILESLLQKGKKPTNIRNQQVLIVTEGMFDHEGLNICVINEILTHNPEIQNVHLLPKYFYRMTHNDRKALISSLNDKCKVIRFLSWPLLLMINSCDYAEQKIFVNKFKLTVNAIDLPMCAPPIANHFNYITIMNIDASYDITGLNLNSIRYLQISVFRMNKQNAINIIQKCTSLNHLIIKMCDENDDYIKEILITLAHKPTLETLKIEGPNMTYEDYSLNNTKNVMEFSILSDVLDLKGLSAYFIWPSRKFEYRQFLDLFIPHKNLRNLDLLICMRSLYDINEYLNYKPLKLSLFIENENLEYISIFVVTRPYIEYLSEEIIDGIEYLKNLKTLIIYNKLHTTGHITNAILKSKSLKFIELHFHDSVQDSIINTILVSLHNSSITQFKIEHKDNKYTR